jgi:hypothetical protein
MKNPAKKSKSSRPSPAVWTGDLSRLRKTRIEQLKTMINNEEYISEAVTKLAKSLTSGLMK